MRKLNHFGVTIPKLILTMDLDIEKILSVPGHIESQRMGHKDASE